MRSDLWRGVLAVALVAACSDPQAPPAPDAPPPPIKTLAKIKSLDSSCTIRNGALASVSASFDVTLDVDHQFVVDSVARTVGDLSGIDDDAYRCGDWATVPATSRSGSGCTRQPGQPELQRIRLTQQLGGGTTTLPAQFSLELAAAVVTADAADVVTEDVDVTCR